MTKTAHTPGPWWVEAGYGYTAIRADAQVVADMRYIGGFTNEANARLIAAAPELLEALRAVKKIVDDAAEHPTGFLVADFQTATYPNSRDAYDGLCAAIAKAEAQS